MIQLSSDRFLRYLLHSYSRRVIALGSGTLLAWRLVLIGWPWWAWLPAALLTAQIIHALLILGIYGYHKLTYQLRAQMMRERLRQERESADGISEPPRQSPDR